MDELLNKVKEVEGLIKNMVELAKGFKVICTCSSPFADVNPLSMFKGVQASTDKVSMILHQLAINAKSCNNRGKPGVGASYHHKLLV